MSDNTSSLGNGTVESTNNPQLKVWKRGFLGVFDSTPSASVSFCIQTCSSVRTSLAYSSKGGATGTVMACRGDSQKGLKHGEME